MILRVDWGNGSQTVYQARKYALVRCDQSSGPSYFDLHIDDTYEISLGNGATLYVMNEQGKTIDVVREPSSLPPQR
jgi:hypothetical protein